GALTSGGFAEAEVQETWHGSFGGGAAAMGLHIHFDGRYDSPLTNACSPNPAGNVELHYEVGDGGSSRGDVSFFFRGAGFNRVATFGGVDVSQFLFFDP